MELDHEDFISQLEELMNDEFFGGQNVEQAELAKWEYPYKPLWGKSSIRLLRLEPGTEHSELRGSLAHVLLDKSPTYEALSYAWGNPDKPHSIHLDDGVIPITESLFVIPLSFLSKPSLSLV
jgi:hypothetical protein